MCAHKEARLNKLNFNLKVIEYVIFLRSILFKCSIQEFRRNLFYAYSLQPQSDIQIINAWIFHAFEMCNEYIFLT